METWKDGFWNFRAEVTVVKYQEGILELSFLRGECCLHRTSITVLELGLVAHC